MNPNPVKKVSWVVQQHAHQDRWTDFFTSGNFRQAQCFGAHSVARHPEEVFRLVRRETTIIDTPWTWKDTEDDRRGT